MTYRIRFHPPLALAKAFSRSGCGRIFPLFSRVMRVGLSTGMGVRRPGSGLSRPIFSGPHDCADLVNSLQDSENKKFSEERREHFGGSRVSRDGTALEPWPIVVIRVIVRSHAPHGMAKQVIRLALRPHRKGSRVRCLHLDDQA